jgi:hypothetical protein
MKGDNSSVHIEVLAGMFGTILSGANKCVMITMFMCRYSTFAKLFCTLMLIFTVNIVM